MEGRRNSVPQMETNVWYLLRLHLKTVTVYQKIHRFIFKKMKQLPVKG